MRTSILFLTIFQLCLVNCFALPLNKTKALTNNRFLICSVKYSIPSKQTFYSKANPFVELINNKEAATSNIFSLSISNKSSKTTAAPEIFTVTGGGYYCSGTSGAVVGLSSSQLGINYQLLRSNGTIAVGAAIAGTGAAISFGNQTTVDTYTVMAVNPADGQTSMMANSVSISVISSSSSSQMPGGISGPSNVCLYAGLSPVTYKINSTLNTTSYLWTVTSGATILGSAFDTVVVVQFDNTFTSGSISASSVNACHNSTSTPRSMPLTKKVPVAPSTIFGPTDLCLYFGTSSNTAPVRYYITRVENATSYLWTVPAGATFSNVSDTSIDVVFPSSFTSGNLSVTAVSPCGNSATAKTLTVYKRLAAMPAAIQQSFVPAIPAVTYVCGIDSQIYRIRKVTYANAYNWTMKNGSKATIIHHNAPGVNDTSVVVRFLSGYTIDTLQVQAVNVCAVSAVKTAILSRLYLPPAVTTITSSSGNFAPCVGNTLTFTASTSTPTSTQGTIKYFRWTKPANTTFVSASSDSSSVTISFNAGYVGGSLSARGVTACGIAGTAKTISMLYGTPTPTGISTSTGSYNACIGNTVTYTVMVGAPSSMQLPASVYRWTQPANTTVVSASSDSSSITLQFNTGYIGGSLTARGQTVCGVLGTAKSQALTHTGCAVGTKMSVPYSTISSFEKATITPNPNDGKFLFSLKTGIDENIKASVIIVNTSGKQIKKLETINKNGMVLLDVKNLDLENGIYFVKYVIGELSGSVKLIVQH